MQQDYEAKGFSLTLVSYLFFYVKLVILINSICISNILDSNIMESYIFNKGEGGRGA